MKTVAAISEEEPAGGALVGRPRKGVWITGVTAAVLVVAGVVVYTQRPGGTPVLPASACWGALSAADLAPLVQGSGRATVKEDPTLRFPFSVLGNKQCAIYWKGEKHDILQADFKEEFGDSYRLDRGLEPSRGIQDVDYGAAIPGFVTRQGYTELYLPCARPGPVADGSLLHVAITIYGAPYGRGGPSRRTRQAYVDITYKLAKAAARQIPCTNPISFAARPPVVR
jgi:hypothetical protein